MKSFSAYLKENYKAAIEEGKMKEFHDMVAKGMTPAQIAKKIDMPVKVVAEFMKDMQKESNSVEEGGLWDNIHAKRKRIKKGSDEKMRKPGSKGAPTDQAFKDAQEEETAAYKKKH